MAFDPNDANLDEVLAKLEKADDQERNRILALEQQGKRRKTILEEYGIDPDQRVDSTGRVLYPWEVDADQQVRVRQPEEDAEARKARELQAEQDQRVAAASPQGGSNPPGTGAAPASGVGVGTAGGDAGPVV